MSTLQNLGQLALDLPVAAWALTFIAAAQPSVRDIIEQNRDDD